MENKNLKQKQLIEKLEQLTNKKVVLKEATQLTIGQYLKTPFYEKLDVLVSDYLNVNSARPKDEDLGELVADYLLDNNFPGKDLLSNYFIKGEDYNLLIDSLVSSFSEDFVDED